MGTVLNTAPNNGLLSIQVPPFCHFPTAETKVGTWTAAVVTHVGQSSSEVFRKLIVSMYPDAVLSTHLISH